MNVVQTVQSGHLEFSKVLFSLGQSKLSHIKHAFPGQKMFCC